MDKYAARGHRFLSTEEFYTFLLGYGIDPAQCAHHIIMKVDDGRPAENFYASSIIEDGWTPSPVVNFTVHYLSFESNKAYSVNVTGKYKPRYLDDTGYPAGESE